MPGPQEEVLVTKFLKKTQRPAVEGGQPAGPGVTMMAWPKVSRVCPAPHHLQRLQDFDLMTGLLQHCPAVRLVGEAANGAEAVSLIRRERPQLALLDSPALLRRVPIHDASQVRAHGRHGV